MPGSLESLLFSIAFLLPGFITTRLLDARTPSKGRKTSIFEETTTSLLRSVYINITVAIIVGVLAQFQILPIQSDLLASFITDWPPNLTPEQSLIVITFAAAWLVASFCIGGAFGYWWDPLHSFSERLVRGIGTISDDPLYVISQVVAQKRDSGRASTQLWVQARMKNGAIYQGEFLYGGFPREEQDRELVLKGAIFYARPSSKPSPELDFVFLDTSNCSSIEFIVT